MANVRQHLGDLSGVGLLRLGTHIDHTPRRSWKIHQPYWSPCRRYDVIQGRTWSSERRCVRYSVQNEREQSHGMSSPSEDSMAFGSKNKKEKNASSSNDKTLSSSSKSSFGEFDIGHSQERRSDQQVSSSTTIAEGQTGIQDAYDVQPRITTSGKHPNKKKKRPGWMSKPELESLEMLEWSSVCKQVASFAMTSGAAQTAYRGRLMLGSHIEASYELLKQTKEAMDVDISFDGVYDLRKAIDAAVDGTVLHPLVLGAFVTTLESIDRMRLEVKSYGVKTRHLQRIFESVPGDSTLETDVIRAVRKCILIEEGRLYDSASDALFTIRAERKQNMTELSKRAEQWARNLHASGVSERCQVVIRRDRRCVPVKAGRNGELPKGSVTLGTSGSGNTLYVEPSPLIELNNTEIWLNDEENEEEERILKELSRVVAERAGSLRRILSAVTKLDLALARAKYTLWIGGEEPVIVDTTKDPLEVTCPDAVHPLMVQPFLPTLPPPKLPQATAMPLDPTLNTLAGINLVPELWNRDIVGVGQRGKPATAVSPSIEKESSTGFPPVPIDILVPQGKRAVIVTGPNTGGKTASMKTLGLIALMAKAGLFIPTRPHSANQDRRIVVPWFDKILADIGDGQSLQQNLSTFSGHVRRLKGVLKESTRCSLVLLDEVGSGTDPTEGAAIASALLHKLAHGHAGLTYATTHHAELKEMASHDSNFVDASVEFNAATLLPTFKILWGQSGESHALAVAEGLGFDPKVIEQARKISSRLMESSQNQIVRVESLKNSLPTQLKEAKQAIKTSNAQLEQAKMHVDVLGQELKDVKAEFDRIRKGKDHVQQEIESKIASIMRKVHSGALSPTEADQQLRQIAEEARTTAASKAMEVILESEPLHDMGGTKQSLLDDISDNAWVPAVGDAVRLLTMGGQLGTVESVNLKKGKAFVRAGALAMDMKIQDLRPGRKEPKKHVQKESRSLTLEETEDGTYGSSVGVAIQTRQNTVDLRGESADDAVQTLKQAIGTSRSGEVLFVIHGVGTTGRVRAAVLEYLRKESSVRKVEQAENSNGGCAVVYLH